MATAERAINRPLNINPLATLLRAFVRFLPDVPRDDLPEWLRGITLYAGYMTPELAEGVLQYNWGNRRPKKRAIAVYNRKMREHRWLFTGQPIIFARTRRGSRLLDGQNRLMACVESGEGFPVLIVDGIDVRAFPYIDRGARRSTADNLEAQGEKSATALSAAVTMLYRWERGIIPTSNHAVEPDDIEDTLARHPNMRDSLNAVRGGIRLLRSHAAAAFLHYEFHRRDPLLADWFFPTLGDPIGARVEKTDGIYWLHRMLDNDLKASNRARTSGDHVVASAIKAWNLHRTHKPGRSLNAIRWRPDRNEAFPGIL